MSVYSAVNDESRHEALKDFGNKWNDKYPMIHASWNGNWNNLIEFFNYPKDIRLNFIPHYLLLLEYPPLPVIENISSCRTSMKRQQGFIDALKALFHNIVSLICINLIHYITKIGQTQLNEHLQKSQV